MYHLPRILEELQEYTLNYNNMIKRDHRDYI